KSPLAPYLYWAKTRPFAAYDLAGSNLLACTLDDLPGAREAVDLAAPDRGGYPPLVEAIAAHYGVGSNRVVTASGCSAANFLAIGALAGPGDAVLMESPGYDQITGACELLGARVETFERRFEDGYRLDLSAIRSQITASTKLIIITSPHNPSGVATERDTLVALQALAEEKGLHVLVDEVYLDVTNRLRAPPSRRGTQDAVRAEGHYPPAALVGDRLLSISSLTKSYGLSGLRCGWVIASPPVAERARRVRDVIDNIGAAPADRLSALAFSLIDRLAVRAHELVSTNLGLTRAFFARHSNLQLAGPIEASIAFPRVAGMDDTEPLVARLFAEQGVAVAAGRVFGAPAHIRISLAGRTETLAEGLARIDRILAA
ncbi:MAG: pyridoxal phosphate-dependent aminotransferase, partial [Vicinamibacteria bacterium]